MKYTFMYINYTNYDYYGMLKQLSHVAFDFWVVNKYILLY